MRNVELTGPATVENDGHQIDGFGKPAGPVKGDSTGGTVPKELRDPRFAELDAAIKGEDTAEPSRRPHKEQRPRSRMPGKKPDSEALSQGKEFVTRLAEVTLREFGDRLTPLELSKLGRTFTSALTPKKKRGRPRMLRITCACEAYAAGIRGVALYSALIPRWNKLTCLRRQVEERKLLSAIRSRHRREVAPSK
jgi:hypothetical protein